MGVVYFSNRIHLSTTKPTEYEAGRDSWRNGTRCRDGVDVLWCHSHLVWLVFRVPAVHAHVFIQKTFL